MVQVNLDANYLATLQPGTHEVFWQLFVQTAPAIPPTPTWDIQSATEPTNYKACELIAAGESQYDLEI